MKILYFAQLREAAGKSEEDVTLPDTVACVSELMAFLARTRPELAPLFAAPENVCVALDEHYAAFDSPLAGVREAAFFPPVTGG